MATALLVVVVAPDKVELAKALSEALNEVKEDREVVAYLESKAGLQTLEYQELLEEASYGLQEAEWCGDLLGDDQANVADVVKGSEGVPLAVRGCRDPDGPHAW